MAPVIRSANLLMDAWDGFLVNAAGSFLDEDSQMLREAIYSPSLLMGLEGVSISGQSGTGILSRDDLITACIPANFELNPPQQRVGAGAEVKVPKQVAMGLVVLTDELLLMLAAPAFGSGHAFRGWISRTDIRELNRIQYKESMFKAMPGGGQAYELLADRRYVFRLMCGFKPGYSLEQLLARG
jgi:hypothetical protein